MDQTRDQRHDPLLQPLLRAVPGDPVASGHTVLPVIRIVDSQPSGAASSSAGGASVAASVVLLAKTIVGAGAAALPFAFSRLGIAVSVTFLLAVAFMTHFSIDALMLGSSATGQWSYPEMVRALLGGRAAALLDSLLVLRCAGLIVVYLVVSTDLLAGGHGLRGLLCDLIPGSEAWCARRAPVALAVALLAMLPLVSMRRITSARLTSAVGLSAVAVWAGVTLALAATAVAAGKAHAMPWLPDPRALDGGSAASRAVNLLATLPVIATAYTCQMAVPMIARELTPYSPRRMSTVSAAAVAVCSAFFLAVGLGSYSVFGRGVPADVLEAFSEAQLAPLVGAAAARALGLAVRVGFLLCVLANVPMQMQPYRESLSNLLLRRDLGGAGFYLITYASLAAFYVAAVSASSIWTPLQLVGATAGAVVAFFMPAAVALKASAAQAEGGRRYWRVNAWVLAVTGVVQVVTGVGAVFLSAPHGDLRL